MSEKRKYFQDYMPENVCFGCGKNVHGLQIKSYWDGEVARCKWQPEEKYHGWKQLLNGGIMATLVDCHCMCTAMAHAYRREQRGLDSKPVYRYATGTMQLRYVKPVQMHTEISLEARIQSYKSRKTTLECKLIAEGELRLLAEVIAIRVYDSSQPHTNNLFS